MWIKKLVNKFKKIKNNFIYITIFVLLLAQNIKYIDFIIKKVFLA